MVWCWGSNSDGQLAVGGTGSLPSPTQVGTNQWDAVACRGSHTCGIDSSGAIVCWGLNSHGQLGNGCVDDLYTAHVDAGFLAGMTARSRRWVPRSMDRSRSRSRARLARP